MAAVLMEGAIAMVLDRAPPRCGRRPTLFVNRPIASAIRHGRSLEPAPFPIRDRSHQVLRPCVLSAGGVVVRRVRRVEVELPAGQLGRRPVDRGDVCDARPPVQRVERRLGMAALLLLTPEIGLHARTGSRFSTLPVGKVENRDLTPPRESRSGWSLPKIIVPTVTL